MSTLVEKLEAERILAQHYMDHYPGVAEAYQYAKGRRDVCRSLLADHAAVRSSPAGTQPAMMDSEGVPFSPAAPAAPDALLDDAMGLLHNHEQDHDAGWLADYEDVCKRYAALAPRKEGEG